MARFSNAAKLVAFALVAFFVIVFVALAPQASGPHGPTPPPTESANEAARKLIAEFFEGAEAKVGCKSDREWSELELQHHASQHDALVVIHGFVLNVTSFLPNHPGGVGALMRGVGGVDAEELFTQFHQPGTMTMFGNFCVGRASGLKPAH
eukprot:CAMPEP_0174831664 /NCGR_PEP_ID=MMETSP1114-20130205/3226_1 /TAXON_ID=312471 /ORGANISM="Neobodo designis, Strain CCAP 1951/1" /LENGTH=150 /DNA_ID=CAMNT_0016065495 /DNA_START=35 /DNA_END=487 /DNA_ORIENTATION=-